MELSMNQIRTELMKILSNYGFEIELEESFLSTQIPSLLIDTLKEDISAKSVSMVCDVVDCCFAHADELQTDDLVNLILNLLAAPRPEIEKLLTFEPWLMTLFRKSPSACSSDASLAELFEKVFVDPWSQEQLRKSPLWSKRYADRTANFLGRVEEWLSKKYGLGVESEDRWGQGASLQQWLGDIFSQAKKKRSHPAALAGIFLVSLGTDSFDDYMKAGEPYSAKFEFKKKSWNYEFAHRAIEDFAKSFEGGGALAKKLVGPHEYRALLEKLWALSAPLEASREELQTFVLLKMASGECCYEQLSVLKRRFPGSYF